MFPRSLLAGPPLRRTSTAVLTALALLLGTLVAGSLGPTTTRATAVGSSPLVDAPAEYVGQQECTRTPEPGTVALARWLTRTYRATGSMGMMRACGSGGRSEHKDGRAFDWRADVRRKAQRRAAYHFIRKALATDAAGNPSALARRMGIMYLIYDDTIWASYRGFQPRPYLHSACKSRKKCSKTLRHRDHVHISLGLAGAAAQTSWYRSRGVASHPVLHPGTNELDADGTAVTGLTVPADGTTTTSSFVLRPGVTYRVVATGTVRHPGAGDANCSDGDGGWALTARGPSVVPPGGDGGWGGNLAGWSTAWNSEGSDHDDSPFALATPETRGLLLAGALRWEGTSCQTDHTYEAWYTPAVRQRLQLQYADPAPGDNTGAFTVYVARDDIDRSSLAR